mgnify:CR=1 FL=1
MKQSLNKLFIAGSLVVPAISVQAQDATDSATAGRFANLEEVVVTARRTEENMQTVPVSVTTFDGDLWLAQPMDEASRGMQWRRVAAGLHEPMSVCL